MEQTTEKTFSLKNASALRLKRPLMPIDEYAAREGVPSEIIEECGQLGIAQIRRYKGRTFVVDVPIGPYPGESEADEGPKEVIRKTSRSGTKLLWRIAASSLVIFLLVSVFVNVWFFGLFAKTDIRFERPQAAGADIDWLFDDSMQISPHAGVISEPLNLAGFEPVNFDRQPVTAEVKMTAPVQDKQLSRAIADFEAMQQLYAGAAERLSEEVDVLFRQLTELSKGSQPADSGISGR